MPGTKIPSPPGAQCRCCGVPILHGTENHVRLGLCIVCTTACSRKHGAALQAHALALVGSGQLDPWRAVAVMSLDNAWLWGTVEPVLDGNGYDLFVRACPRPWQVTIARCAAQNRMPGQDELMSACMLPHVPGPDTIERRQAIADEITTALCWLDGDVSSVDVDFEKDTLDLGHLIIRVNLKTAVPGAIAYDATAGTDVPIDIMARARGQA